MEVVILMQNKEKNNNGNFKINRYNQIDLIGSYGVKDNYQIGQSKETKENIVLVIQWLGILLVMCVPVVGIITLIAMACADINQSMKNFARAALIFMVIMIILFLLYL